MSDSELEISTRAYCKILMHAAKYPSSSINGLLLSKVEIVTRLSYYHSIIAGWGRQTAGEVCGLHPHAPHQHWPGPHGGGRSGSGTEW